MATISRSLPQRFIAFFGQVKRHVRPYHLAVAGAAGLITVVFLVIIGVLILITTNFNLLGAVE